MRISSRVLVCTLLSLACLAHAEVDFSSKSKIFSDFLSDEENSSLRALPPQELQSVPLKLLTKSLSVKGISLEKIPSSALTNSQQAWQLKFRLPPKANSADLWVLECRRFYQAVKNTVEARILADKKNFRSDAEKMQVKWQAFSIIASQLNLQFREQFPRYYPDPKLP